MYNAIFSLTSSLSHSLTLDSLVVEAARKKANELHLITILFCLLSASAACAAAGGAVECYLIPFLLPSHCHCDCLACLLAV